jgi:D-alanyl-D-alanine carboxypeptidase (penicillin-binding protein 5/6)
MSDMRPEPDGRLACRPQGGGNARRATSVRKRLVGSAGLLLVVAVQAAASPAAAITSPSPVPPESAPAPLATLEPPPGSPFDEVVGGAGLATTGAPATPAEGAPVPAVDATAWLVADLDSGDVLAALNAHQPLPPASTIKLLTALALLPSLDEADVYTATDDDALTPGSRVGLVPGQRYSVADLEHGLLLASGNDAAHALAASAGMQDRATSVMNEEAERLGAFDTNATTPHGLDEPGQVSSAYDLALIGRAVLDDERLARLVRTPTYDFPGLDGATFQIQNQNRLLGSYEGTIGLKTGYTTQAGHTLVAAAERDGARLIVVVLGAEGRAEVGARSLLDWGFAAQGVPPVGRLVTPDEVAAAHAGDDPDAVPDQGPAQSVADAVDTAARLPVWVWPTVALVAAAVVVGLLWRRRRRASGRYSAPS